MQNYLQTVFTNGSQTFSASYDVTTKITSGIVIAMMGAAAYLTQNWLVMAAGLLIIGLSYAYSPQGYEVEQRSIVVRRLIGRVRIPLEDVRELRPGTPEDFKRTIRRWGSGGLFGYYGLFQTAKLGKCTWYVTNRRKTVVLVSATKTVVFSPDDVERFLMICRAEAPVVGVVGGPVEGAIEPRRAGFRWMGAVIGAAAVLIAHWVFTYSPGPPKVTVTADALTIHDRFYGVTVPAASVDVARVRVVDLMTERDWRPISPTNGFANGHYQSGWFRAANGQKMRLYSAGGRRLVLLPARGTGTSVLLDAPDPDRLADEIRRTWSRLL